MKWNFFSLISLKEKDAGKGVMNIFKKKSKLTWEDAAVCSQIDDEKVTKYSRYFPRVESIYLWFFCPWIVPFYFLKTYYVEIENLNLFYKQSKTLNQKVV